MEQFEKRGNWSAPKVVLEYDKETGTVIVPGKNNKKIQAAIEDVCHALPVDSLASSIQEGIDSVATSIETCIDDLTTQPSDGTTPLMDSEGEEQSHDVPMSMDDTAIDDDDERLSRMPDTGDNIELYWPDDDTFYPGTVSSINEDQKYNIDYDDGEKETLELSTETWRFSSTEDGIANVHNAFIAEKDVTSSEQDVLRSYLDTFGHNVFLQYHAQGLPSFPLQNAYECDEEAFKKTVETVPATKVPQGANIIIRHVIVV